MTTETTDLHELLRTHWGYDRFRPLQLDAVEAVLAGRDSLVVMPTGGGKSLCFQLPALTGDGLALVVSPLISLMKDQVDTLVGNGIPAAYYNSSLSAAERDRVSEGIRAGRYRLLYVSPERLVGAGGEWFRRSLEGCRLRFVAIDEAHCISHWGHDFRPEYRQIGRLREEFPEISLHAYTATATSKVRRDIVTQLGLRDPEVLVGSFDRPNLVFRVLRRASVDRQVRTVVRRHEGDGGIVYCISRRKVESLTNRLVSWGHRAVSYHAGLSAEDRASAQDDFLDERVDIVVATVAFGMGIDRSNVRFVVHAGAPRSLEHYLQEAGRAGRDGLAAECALIYSPADFMTWRRLLERDGELSPESLQLLREMETYAGRSRCRHRSLVEHFGEAYEASSCDACDWCLGELQPVPDATTLGRKILSCVARVRQRFGVGHVVAVLRGQDNQRVLSRGHDQLSTFGLLDDVSTSDLRCYIDQLLEQGYLALDGDEYPILKMTTDGVSLLKGEAECELLETPKPPRATRTRRSTGAGGGDDGWEGVDRELFERLREHRLEIARTRGVPPYVIFHDTTLRALARQRPGSLVQLLEVRGIGEKKAADLGEELLRTIREHVPSESETATPLT